VLYGLCNRSQQWCSSAAGLLSGVSQLGEAALQLEYSRRGRLWAPGATTAMKAPVKVPVCNVFLELACSRDAAALGM
jgi:hypothetical protein